MLALSSLLLMPGCAWHVGNPPMEGGWRLEPVAAPVAEADVDEAVRTAVSAALSARGAVGDTALDVVVLRADLDPAQRGTDLLLYTATLEIELRAGARTRRVRVQAPTVDPGSAGAAQAARASLFTALAERAAAEGVAWLVDGG